MKKSSIMSQRRANRAADVMEFIRFNTQPNVKQIAERFCCSVSMSRDAITILLSAKKIERVTHKKRLFNCVNPDTFIIGTDSTPFDTSRDVPGNIDRREQAECKRIIGPAKQLGIARDDMIAAFFGPARGA